MYKYLGVTFLTIYRHLPVCGSNPKLDWQCCWRQVTWDCQCHKNFDQWIVGRSQIQFVVCLRCLHYRHLEIHRRQVQRLGRQIGVCSLINERIRFLHKASVNVLPGNIHRSPIRIPPVHFCRFLILFHIDVCSCNTPLFAKSLGGERHLLLAGVEDVWGGGTTRGNNFGQSAQKGTGKSPWQERAKRAEACWHGLARQRDKCACVT